MKKAIKIFGIVVLAMAIAFSMIACDDGSGGPGGGGGGQTGGGGGGGSTGAREGTGWPPSNVRSSYGIGGLNAPSGSSGIRWAVTPGDRGGDWSDALVIQWNQTSDASSYFINWFTSNGWRGDYMYSMGAWQKGSQAGVLMGGDTLVMYNNYTGPGFF